MHVLYVHQNFPAQFGHIARHLVNKLGWRCSFVSETPGGIVEGIEKIQYKLGGGATKQNHFCTRTFENTVWHCHAVYNALVERPEIKPDLIVGHSGFGSTLFLRELYPETPIVNFFEYYYRSHDADSDMDFRRDLNWQVPEIKYLRSRCRNAMILLDLQNCQIGYTPTQFQKSRFPREYDDKIRTIFDGVDREVYHGYGESLRPPVSQRGPRTIAGQEIAADMRVVTYVSRGFESMRGFDIFMKAAKIICDRMPNVVFLVIGTDRIAYGGDEGYLGGKSFKQWVLDQDQYDLSRIRFVGRLPMDELGRTLASSDLHIYLTVPFVLSWSMMDAMSCGAAVLASDTSPVKEMIQDGQNGLLADFFSPEDFADKACRVLADPDAYRHLGQAAEKMVAERYSLEALLPQMLQLYDDALNIKTGLEAAHERGAVQAPRPRAKTAAPSIAKATGLKANDILTGKAPPKGWSPFRG
ncbi:MAG: glycosyltransferase [Burkholderiales bacterium]|nr:glycosyltransferase [Phycisphaerae bacterium]